MTYKKCSTFVTIIFCKLFKLRLKTIFNQKLYKISHSHCFNVISLCPKLLKKFISNRDLGITNILLRVIHAHHPKLLKHQPRYKSCLSVNPEKLKLSKYNFFLHLLPSLYLWFERKVLSRFIISMFCFWKVHYLQYVKYLSWQSYSILWNFNNQNIVF